MRRGPEGSRAPPPRDRAPLRTVVTHLSPWALAFPPGPHPLRPGTFSPAVVPSSPTSCLVSRAPLRDRTLSSSVPTPPHRTVFTHLSSWDLAHPARTSRSPPQYLTPSPRSRATPSFSPPPRYSRPHPGPSRLRPESPEFPASAAARPLPPSVPPTGFSRRGPGTNGGPRILTNTDHLRQILTGSALDESTKSRQKLHTPTSGPVRDSHVATSRSQSALKRLARSPLTYPSRIKDRGESRKRKEGGHIMETRRVSLQEIIAVAA